MIKYFQNRKSKNLKTIGKDTNDVKVFNKLNADADADANVNISNVKSIVYYSIDKNEYVETYVPLHMNVLDVKDLENLNNKNFTKSGCSPSETSTILDENVILDEIYNYYLGNCPDSDQKFDYIDKYFSYDVVNGVYYYK